MRNIISYVILFLMLAISVNAFYMSDTFSNGLLDFTKWNQINESGSSVYWDITETSVLSISGNYTGGSKKNNWSGIQTVNECEWYQNCTAVIDFLSLQSDILGQCKLMMGVTDFDMGDGLSYGWVGYSPPNEYWCGVVVRADYYDDEVIAYEFFDADTTQNKFASVDLGQHELRIEVKRLHNSSLNKTRYYVYWDNGLVFDQPQTDGGRDCGKAKLNFTIAYACPVLTSAPNTFRLDNAYWYSTTAATCSEPCVVNESFDYTDSICNHGWFAAECGDLNLPAGGLYICNESSQVIAYYFGKITKNSGLVDVSFDLRINDDYEVLVGLTDTHGEAGLVWYYDRNTIFGLRDNTNISTYAYNQTYTYLVRIDLTNNQYDFYQDGVLKAEDLTFYQPVDDLYSIFIQPDYMKGSPYCDYVLDNLQIGKQIAGRPQENGTYVVADYWDLNWDNASFDWDKACRENEHPQMCVIRATFEGVFSNFTDYVFDNFLLVLVLLVVILMLILLKKYAK